MCGQQFAYPNGDVFVGHKITSEGYLSFLSEHFFALTRCRQVDLSFSATFFVFLLCRHPFLFFAMYTLFVFLLLLVAQFAQAIPVPAFKLNINADTSKDKANAQRIKDAETKVNDLLPKMDSVLKKAKTDSAAAAKVSAAFGKDWAKHHDKLTAMVGDMKGATMTIADANPKTYDEELAKKREKQIADLKKAGKKTDGLTTPDQIRKDGSNAVWSPNSKMTSVGSMWHNKAQPLHQAGTLIHELSHQVARTGDHVVKADSTIVNSEQAKKVAGDVELGGGYIKGGMTAEKIKQAGPAGLPSDWKTLMDKSPNTYNNADSWKVFSALCDRRLRRRALTEGDPVDFYLTKRAACQLPPDYFAKKAAAKKAAAAKEANSKSTTTGSKSTDKGSKTSKASGIVSKSGKAAPPKAKTGKTTSAKGKPVSKGKTASNSKAGSKSKTSVKGKATSKGKPLTKGKATSKTKPASKGKVATKGKNGAKNRVATKGKTVPKGKTNAKSKTTSKAKAVNKGKTTATKGRNTKGKVTTKGRAGSKAVNKTKNTKGKSSAPKGKAGASKATTKPNAPKAASPKKAAAPVKAGKKPR
ncbi:hypothetical protein CPB86DRAFT_759100 [Serendipita vermifera]|nr:hypothetical protein CPB86DRAFT_759100 [Serendipita vermifera]